MMDSWTQIPFQGSSMNPSFFGVDTVLVDFSKKPQPQIGDILVYRDQSDEWICHRFIFQDENRWWVMGDANSSVDYVPPQSVWGVVRAVRDGEHPQLLKKTIFTDWICYFQYQQVCSKSFGLKKIYRILSKLLLYLDNWFSKRSLIHKKS